MSEMFLCEFVYVYCVNSFTHVERYSDGECRGSHLVEPIRNRVVECVECRHCGMLYFVPALCGSVGVCNDVRK